MRGGHQPGRAAPDAAPLTESLQQAIDLCAE
jgi:hypothetical protein